MAGVKASTAVTTAPYALAICSASEQTGGRVVATPPPEYGCPQRYRPEREGYRPAAAAVRSPEA
jgi:hypothetical protein